MSFVGPAGDIVDATIGTVQSGDTMNAVAFLGAQRVNDNVFAAPIEGRHRTVIAVLSDNRQLVLNASSKTTGKQTGPPPLADALPDIATNAAAGLQG